MKAKTIKILGIIGMLLMASALLVPPIAWILLLEGVFTEICYDIEICGIASDDIRYWGGLLLMLPYIICKIKQDAIIKVFIILFLIVWGYFFYCGQWKIGCGPQ